MRLSKLCTTIYNPSRNLVLRRPVESAQYPSIRYSERLAEACIGPSVGSSGDSYDNALAETINGLTRPKSSTDAAPGRPSRPSS